MWRQKAQEGQEIVVVFIDAVANSLTSVLLKTLKTTKV